MLERTDLRKEAAVPEFTNQHWRSRGPAGSSRDGTGGQLGAQPGEPGVTRRSARRTAKVQEARSRHARQTGNAPGAAPPSAARVFVEFRRLFCAGPTRAHLPYTAFPDFQSDAPVQPVKEGIHRGHVTFARDGRAESVQNGQRISVRLATGASHDREKANTMKDPGIHDADKSKKNSSKNIAVDSLLLKRRRHPHCGAKPQAKANNIHQAHVVLLGGPMLPRLAAGLHTLP